MKKDILAIGIIWAILTVIVLMIVSGYDPIESGVTESQNTILALMIFQFIPSSFPVAYYLKKKSVPKRSCCFRVTLHMVILGNFIYDTG